MRGIIVLALLSLAGCPPPSVGPTPRPPTAPPTSLPPVAPASITVARVTAPDDVPADPPPPGTWRLHMIDVGTGLSILIQGHDFALLYDAGTNDRGETPQRVLAYLAATLGASGDDLCVGKGEPLPAGRQGIDHVVLSHPHFDHASALDEVLHCYDVKNLWDSGAVNDTVFYRELLETVARSVGLTYHTAAPPPTGRSIGFKKGAVTIPAGVPWTTFSEGDAVELGDGARFELLHAEGKQHHDMNENSVVIAVELGGVKVLLVGDAESGPRADPSMPVGDIEQHLVDHFAKQIDADILQVGHHGSKTSSRAAFLAAVSPRFALVSVGPKAYGKVTLPDAEVIEALTATGAEVLRTDARDAACPVGERLGGDSGPGGCDSYILTITR
jgi:competence protein ComEC